MVQIGRNDPCPCGSGKKHKRCCLPRQEAAQEAARQAEARGRQVESDYDQLDERSNGVLALIKRGRLDEAEAQARDLLQRYPDVIDGLSRLAAVYEAKGDKAKAVEYHRKAAVFAETNDGYDPEIAMDHREAAARLERA